jgi:hypothetical protein
MQRIRTLAPRWRRIRQSGIRHCDPPAACRRKPLLVWSSRQRLARWDNEGPLRDGERRRERDNRLRPVIGREAREKLRLCAYSIRNRDETHSLNPSSHSRSPRLKTWRAASSATDPAIGKL